MTVAHSDMLVVSLLVKVILHLFDITAKQVNEVEGPRDLGVVLAQAPVHLAPRAQVHDFADQLLPYVHLHIGRVFAEAEP